MAVQFQTIPCLELTEEGLLRHQRAEFCWRMVSLIPRPMLNCFRERLASFLQIVPTQRRRSIFAPSFVHFSTLY